MFMPVPNMPLNELIRKLILTSSINIQGQKIWQKSFWSCLLYSKPRFFNWYLISAHGWALLLDASGITSSFLGPRNQFPMDSTTFNMVWTCILMLCLILYLWNDKQCVFPSLMISMFIQIWSAHTSFCRSFHLLEFMQFFWLLSNYCF